MIKKVKVEELRPGMYIHDLNCGWLDHPFLKNSLKVKDEKTIEKISSYGIREVYIDTSQGEDVANAPTREEVLQEIRDEINRVVETKVDVRPKVPLKEEIKRARQIKKEAKKTINIIMDDVRFGKQIETEKVEHVVSDMVQSILRNEDALISLSKIRRLDEYTYMHSMTVCILMISFGRHLGYDEETLTEVGVGALLHDVGKMKIPQEILTKTTKLDDDEYALMKEHVNYGRSMLEETQNICKTAMLVAYQHHERFDGTGYPNGLKGDEITLFGQAIAITDVYDAMTSKRCYQMRFEPTDVLRKLYEWSEYHFNKELVQRFIRCVGIYPIGSLVRLQSGFLAVVIRHGEKSLLHPVVKAIYNIKKERLIYPFEVDLSNEMGDKVVCHESAEKWNLEPERYL